MALGKNGDIMYHLSCHSLSGLHLRIYKERLENADRLKYILILKQASAIIRQNNSNYLHTVVVSYYIASS
jgi:hypothetical protein